MPLNSTASRLRFNDAMLAACAAITIIALEQILGTDGQENGTPNATESDFWQILGEGNQTGAIDTTRSGPKQDVNRGTVSRINKDAILASVPLIALSIISAITIATFYYLRKSTRLGVKKDGPASGVRDGPDSIARAAKKDGQVKCSRQDTNSGGQRKYNDSRGNIANASHYSRPALDLGLVPLERCNSEPGLNLDFVSLRGCSSESDLFFTDEIKPNLFTKNRHRLKRELNNDLQNIDGHDQASDIQDESIGARWASNLESHRNLFVHIPLARIEKSDSADEEENLNIALLTSAGTEPKVRCSNTTHLVSVDIEPIRGEDLHLETERY